MATHGEERMGLRLVGHSDLGGSGDGMQVMLKDDVLFVGRMKPGNGVCLLDVSDPKRPTVIGELPAYPDTWHTKVQVAGDLLMVNYEQRGHPNPQGRTGFAIFDISNPRKPKELTYINTGGIGIHRMWWTGERYAYLSGQPDGFRHKMLTVWDMSDPEHPEEVGRWWYPGLWEAGGEEPTALEGGWERSLHHGIPHGDLLYCGLWDGGFGILDISDPSKPTLISQVSWVPDEGSRTHTALPLPGRNLAVVLDESTKPNCDEPPKYVRIFDVSDPRAPRLLSKWQAPRKDHCRRGGRFGPHNIHENRPGSFQSEERVYITYFNGGLRVLDISNPENPTEVAYYIPAPVEGQQAIQTNDVYVTEDADLIFITDRTSSGVHILEHE